MNINTNFTRSLVCLLSAFALAVSAWAEPYTQLQTDWAKAKYELSGKEQEKFLETLMGQADAAKQANPDSAEVFAWSGIIYSTYAGAKGGMGALKFAKQAKKDLEKSLKINGSALQGSASTTLGTLYFKVPGWPVAFGNDKLAKELLTVALEQNPNGIDSNYWYAEYLYSKKKNKEALQYLDKAEQAAPRPERPLADKGRREEIAKLRAEITNN